ncbi:MAG: hypothetical protein COZ18_16160 [Flexibacter sp. CG_4_10_14_3_um_filter_32_15]|nr:MAG: hypothetical protein COZ18_16160 [Flexibacter sp. CG_4_10_14_3_um_filter_32_15]
MKKFLLGLVFIFSLSLTASVAQDYIDFDGDGSGGSSCFNGKIKTNNRTGLKYCAGIGKECMR